MIDVMIKALIFDWFGVCTVENWKDTFARKLSKQLNLPESFIKEKFKPLVPAFASAELTPKTFLETFIPLLDKTKSPSDFKFIFKTLPKINFALLKLILKLKKRYPVFLLSNNFGPVFPNYEKQIDFNKYFSRLFLSHKLKISKTQEGIWEKVLSEIDLDPSEILFIDNTEKYLEPAREHKVKTILFLNNAQLKKELANFGIEI